LNCAYLEKARVKFSQIFIVVSFVYHNDGTIGRRVAILVDEVG
jgi:hypothetical protein